jgi:hypothetical protein
MFSFCLNSPRSKARRSLFAHFLSTHLLPFFLFMATDSRVIEALVLLSMFEEKGLSDERRNMEINIIRCITQLFS